MSTTQAELSLGNLEGDLWDSLLQDASNRDTMLQKTLLLFGDVNSGKSSLLAKVQGVDQKERPKNLALDYTYIDVSADDSEDDIFSRINVWQVDVDFKDLIKHAIHEENFSNALVAITVDFSKPWELEKSILTRLDILRKHLEKFPQALIEERKREIARLYLSYEERRAGRKLLSDAGLEQLPQGILEVNLGIPLLIVCCKTDYADTLESEYDYKEYHFEFIQQHLRRICLKCMSNWYSFEMGYSHALDGAGLIYTSVKSNINCDIFFDYMQHLLYGMDFTRDEQIIERNSTFVPIGWDSFKKIQEDLSNLKISPDTPFEEVVPKVKEDDETETFNTVVTEDDDQFLQRLYLKSQDGHDYTKKMMDKVASVFRDPSSLAKESEAPKPQEGGDFSNWLQTKMNTQNEESSL